MDKLTKEQAEWLIERLCSEITYQLNNVPSHQIKEIIHQCTEKEFPELQMQTEDRLIDIQITGREIDDEFNQVCVEISNQDDGHIVIPLYSKEFKQFTEGCNKIVKWLNEQS